ncbi:glycosidase [Hypnocyclicus thermotrophus]|uniref:Glycosidase n=1 Tax=Hypnocyclicus thermotrophus TaxID=1627895 RepID=A0AA46DZU0_9FUSO|nr:alpha-amylase family glycosyl hydrolase [Hypnocyclicus thermotrophus]TDT72023.1 glycosidase [Hypnocyclicus thermotrophus]
MNLYNEKIFYHIYPLGFSGAPENNDFYSKPVERLEKIIEWIPHMKYLGINALYLGPIFESVEHGYDTVDYFKIDRRLGTNDSFKKVVNELHANKISVIVDGVFNHVGRNHFAFKDLQHHKKKSKYINWFNGVDFSKKSPYNDPFTYNTWDGHYNLVKLNLKNQEVKEHLFDAVKYWINEFNIDGIRLDAADVLDFTFMKELSELVKNMKKNFWLMGEVVHGDYSKWINDARLDSVTNYECYKGLYSSHNDKNYFEIAHSLKRQFAKGGIYENMSLFSFIDNHDVERISTIIKNKEDLFNLHLLLFSIPGIPSLYYGSEWKIEGKKGSRNDISLRPKLDINYMNSNYETDLINYISKLSQIRKNLNSIKYGSYKEIFVKSEQFAFEREYNNEKTIIILNSSKNNVTINEEKIPKGRYIDVLNNNELLDLQNKKEIKINSFSGRILKKII